MSWSLVPRVQRNVFSLFYSSNRSNNTWPFCSAGENASAGILEALTSKSYPCWIFIFYEYIDLTYLDHLKRDGDGAGTITIYLSDLPWVHLHLAFAAAYS
jgi:hypothetical protein